MPEGDLCMDTYRITDWWRYEVTEKGHIAKIDTPLEQLRKKPLEYIRWTNFGHRLGPAFRKLNKKAWPYGPGIAEATFGIFGKCLELAADQQREYRGWILDEKQNPVDAKAIAELLEWDVDVVTRAMEILCCPEIQWLEFKPFSPIYRELPVNPANLGALSTNVPAKHPGLFQNETETEVKRNKNETVRENPDSRPSASDFPPSVSASVSKTELGKKRNQATMQLAEIFRPQNQSDGTTLRNIIEHLEMGIFAERFNPEIYDAMLEVAHQCHSARKPIAMFVQAMKDPRFGYRPERKRLIKTDISRKRPSRIGQLLTPH